MPGIAVTLTVSLSRNDRPFRASTDRRCAYYALPVCAEALAAQVKAQIDARPTLHALRLCNRFGHGSFSDCPVELIQMIEGFIIKEVHEEVTKELEVASRCFKNKCSIVDHADRSRLLKLYAKCATFLPRDFEDFPDDPNDEQLVQVLKDNFWYTFSSPVLEDYEEEEAHQTNRFNWPKLVGGIFSQSNRREYQKRFGLDIWSSFVSLPHDGMSGSDEFGFPQATIAYLTLPDSVERRRKWSGNLREKTHFDTFYEYPSTHGQNGFGMAVNINRRPSAEELSRFPQALKVLKLQVFVHPSQKHFPALGLGRPYEHKKLDAPNTPETSGGFQKSKSLVKPADNDDSKRAATSVKKDKSSASRFPRLMLLMRSED